MATVTLIYQKTNVTIDAITLDASVSEMHTTTVETTDSPVETGVDVTDHLRKKPDGLKIEGLITNTPLPTSADAPATQTITTQAGTFQYVSRSVYSPGADKVAFDSLRALAGSGTLFTVHTQINDYDNMALVSLDVPRDAKTGKALRFTATFKQIQIVQNQTAQVPRVDKGKPTVNQGKKAAAETTKSWALSGAQLFGLVK